MAETTTIQDPRLTPYILKTKDGVYDVYKKGWVTPKDKNKERYELERTIGHCKDLDSAIKFIIQKKIEDDSKKVVTLIEYYKLVRDITEEVRLAFNLDYKTEIEQLKKEIKSLKEAVASLTK